MDPLDDILGGSTIDVTIAVPKPVEKTKKDWGSASGGGPKADAAAQSQSSKGKNSEKGPKSKEQDPKSKPKRDHIEAAEGGSAPTPFKKQKIQQMLEKKGEKVEDITLADFQICAKVAKFGAAAFKKLEETIAENSTERLREISEENRRLKAKADKLAAVQMKLDEANNKVIAQNKKLEKMLKLEEDLKKAREDLEKVKEEAEAEVAKKAAEIEDLKKERADLKNNAASMAKLGFQRCLEMVVLLEPKVQLEYLQLGHRVVDGGIMRGNKVVFVLSSQSSPEDARNDEAVETGNETPAAVVDASQNDEEKTSPESERAETRAEVENQS